MSLIFALFSVISIFSVAKASPETAADSSDEPIFHQGLEKVSLEQALAQVQPGEAVVLGEAHGTLVQAAQQLQVLEMLRKNGHLVSLGMEFFEYPTQALVDSYRQGELSEAEFLAKAGWGMGFSYDAYRNQVLFPRFGLEDVIALNAPRTLTGRISKVGMEGLTAEEKALLPPDWALGNQGYFERFQKVMGDHLPSADALNRYFAAQSTWDDTMAWRAAEYLKAHPDHILVIIVGEFHVQYGGGLPDRLKARGVKSTTFSLVNTKGMTDEERKSEIEPSSDYGSRADFVWESQFSL
jgi:uncharacterized iron-regulated protein